MLSGLLNAKHVLTLLNINRSKQPMKLTRKRDSRDSEHGTQSKDKAWYKARGGCGLRNLKLHTKVTSRQGEPRGLSWDTLGMYLEVKLHLQDKEKHDLLLFVNN